MPNTHGHPDRALEVQAICGDLLPVSILSSPGAAVPVPPSLTFAPFGTYGYVYAGTSPVLLVYVEQPAHSVTLSGTDGTYWLALHRDTQTAVAGWSREAGTHYLWRSSGAAPGNPAGGLTFGQVTVAGGVITAVTGVLAALGPPLARQNAGAVAITGGSILNLSAFSLNCPAVVPLQVPAGIQVTGPLGLGTSPTAGYQLNVGPFPSAFQGQVGIKTIPTHDLDVAGTLAVSATAEVTGAVGLGRAPDPAYSLRTAGDVGVGANLVVTGTAAKPGGGPWADTSDRRLKADLAPLRAALETLLALTGYTYTRPDRPGPQIGFVADEVEAVLPAWVGRTPEGYQTVCEVGFPALVVEALKTLVARLEALEAR
jgi:hypothetical protein